MSGRFQAIYADPPWQYRDSGVRGGVDHHYRTMSLEQLRDMRRLIDGLAAENCALFMWATWPMLPEAIALIGCWGFRYKTCAFTWCKTTKDRGAPSVGLGHWTRGNTEPCLLAVRGKPTRLDKGVRQVIFEGGDPLTAEEATLYSTRTRHSAKPGEARDRIVRLLGDVPRIELFARERVPGWDAWGNQLPPEVAA